MAYREESSFYQKSAESFNAHEVLAFLSARYEEELTEAKQDKTGEKYRIYQSLDSNSAWSIKSSSSGKRSAISDEYNLLKELNRGMLRRRSQRS